MLQIILVQSTKFQVGKVSMRSSSQNSSTECIKINHQ